ncbi:hypothetical protein BD324DRAFT_446614 [Kockovaella imperatae]|uniref:Zn(2)-C6 fungal-type domain-containing protein n=1 Tax=Kockovaella imperatae TaxID=4999 RepID=A0A1Y1UH57_9TREE|nr:hypothetical protein BD324DRAFT_446614 [Kockovaella imperatae]ORX37390.1 hypothetical protein BD324DRAFT_446614 [Kockovaella imperatae]
MSDSMNSTPPGAVDDKFAPLKRNHACLQCKKRKVKCDAIHPTCSPCMRSYHHAARAAQRNKSELPVLVCTYAEVDSNPGSEDEMPILIRSGEEKRKKRSRDANPAQTRHRDDDIGMETEREALMARIAELEHRLNGLTPTDSIPSRPSSSGPRKPTTPSRAFDETTAWLQGALTSNPKGQNPPVHVSQPIASQATIPASIAPNLDAFDFGSYFLVPMHWPPGLPSPFLLEHLIETFFNSVPHFGRILHRASLLARVRLPPTSPDFPHASLLHSICATAATHTAWVNNVPAEAMEEMLLKNQFLKTSLEISEDFALMQGDLAEKSMKQAASLCMMGPGNTMLEIAQASTILAEVYYNKSLPMQGWIISAFGPRLLHALELMNKNRANSVKEPLLTEPRDTFDREQRIATVWATFIVDAGFALNSFWAGSIDFAELLTPFPASTIHFHSKDDSIPPNPQTAFTPDMLTHHPVQDPFALACKASTLTWRSAKWIRTWTQRDQVPGDTLNGLARPDFMELIKDITGFQASIPVSMKNLFKILDQSSGQSFDADILMIHIMPNLSLALIYEAMLDWDNPNPYCVQQIQKAFEGIIGVLYLIPTNLDVSLVLTSLLAFSIYTTGRILSNFIQHAIGAEQFTVAMRYRADLQTCQNVLSRYGQKHALGLMMSKFLEAYISVPARNLRASNQ